MSVPRPIERRRFLQVALGVGSAAVMAKLAPWRALVEVVNTSLEARLTGLLEHRASARVVGSEYLRAAPEEADARALLNAIASRLPGDADGAQDASPGELRELVARSVRSDFADGLTVRLRGWIVSRTEARLCALAAVRDRDRTGRRARRA